VKVAVYEKPEFLMLPWQARGLYRMITPHLGPDGRLYVGADPVAGLAVILHAPAEEIRQAFVDLSESGFVLSESGGTLFDPGFIQSKQADRPNLSESRNPSSLEVEVEVDKEEEKKKPSGRPPGDPRHRPFIDRFHDLWGQLRGGKYEVAGKDVKAMSRFLKGHPDTTLEEFERRMRLAFADPWFAQNGNLATFISRWVNYDRRITLVATPVNYGPSRREVVGMNEETGEVIYR
jgi:hypothetical protein